MATCHYCGERPHQWSFCPYSSYNRGMETKRKRDEKAQRKTEREAKRLAKLQAKTDRGAR